MHFLLINNMTEHVCTQISMKYVSRNTPFIDFFSQKNKNTFRCNLVQNFHADRLNINDSSKYLMYLTFWLT